VKTVLVVDDNATLSYLMSHSLQAELEGVRVLTVATCVEALMVVHSERPAVAIVDLKLPDGDGSAVVRELSKKVPNAAVIVASADAPSPEIEDLIVGFVLKPYEPAVLINMVRTALGPSGPGLGRTDDHVDRRKKAPCIEYDHHRIQNRLTGMMALLKALEADLVAEADDPASVLRIANEYVTRLCAITMEVSRSLPKSFTDVSLSHD
jgi:CheY-like chemotaxis protein